eukprot:TRINITY_DN6361_c0_g1_i1.p1 TRINITY_DN6361_c0_g1~~TRINITY_DN6361_c0_g1_i1.p1  ORF type:complete len:101 (-),score=35.23 TRINITY_DN6361_c0_g1_i1:89-391(-)
MEITSEGVQALGALCSLKSLSLNGCAEIRDFTLLLPSLTSLDLQGLTNVTDSTVIPLLSSSDKQICHLKLGETAISCVVILTLIGRNLSLIHISEPTRPY